MNLRNQLSSTAVLLLLTVIDAACTDLTELTDVSEDDSVDSTQLYAIRFAMPGYCATSADGWTYSVNDTRSDIDTDLAAKLTNASTYSFSNGTTLWVLVEKSVNGKYQKMPSSLNVAYSVLTVTDANGTTSSDMVPCTVDSMGNALSTESKLLYLPKGNYRIRAISPALPLSADSNKVTVKNGMSLLANYDRCEATAPLILTESNFTQNASGSTQEIQLKPLVHQTAYLQFDIRPATTEKHIYSIEPMENGCEVSGLQGNMGEFNWTANDPTWTIYLNDKVSYVTIPDSNFVADQTDASHLICGASILPTSVESSTVFVTLNLRVNGVPTEYMTSITDMKFNLGYKYPFNIYVTLDNKISMATWVNSATSQNITITPSTSTN